MNRRSAGSASSSGGGARRREAENISYIHHKLAFFTKKMNKNTIFPLARVYLDE
jgi:hypothetical protein